MASPQIKNSTGAFGYSQPPTAADTSKAELLGEYVAATTIAAGEVAALSSDGFKIAVATVGMSPRLAVGIAAEPIAAGASGNIILRGPAYAVKKDGSVLAAGDVVGISTSSAGAVGLITAATVITQAKDTGLVLGTVVNTATAAGTTATVYISKL